MSVTATDFQVQKDFGTYHDRALAGEAIRVTRHGRETVYIVSAKTFHELKQGRRQAIASAELSDAEMALIEAAEIPAEHRYSVGDD